MKHYKFIILSFMIGIFFACNNNIKLASDIKRNDLFSLSIGKLEDQIDLIQNQNSEELYNTNIAMNAGLIYISNGNAGKVVEFSSYGDLLSMIYNPSRNPEPITLKPKTDTMAGINRYAMTYDFINPGKIVVSSKKDIFVEDVLPIERQVISDNQTILSHVILRFSSTGDFKDYIGQEGVGGTPFQYISNIYCTANDELVVVTQSFDGWQVFWYGNAGNLIYGVTINKNSLPLLDDSQKIPIFDKIIPDMENQMLYVKIDYYQDAIDPINKTSSGIDFFESYIWFLSPKDATFSNKLIIPSQEKTVGTEKNMYTYKQIYEFLGSARGNNLFFILPENEKNYNILIVNTNTKSKTKSIIDIDPDAMIYNNFFLSNDGILTGFFASQFNVNISWWRFDNMIGDIRR